MKNNFSIASPVQFLGEASRGHRGQDRRVGDKNEKVNMIPGNPDAARPDTVLSYY